MEINNLYGPPPPREETTGETISKFTAQQLPVILRSIIRFLIEAFTSIFRFIISLINDALKRT
jgi:hypothetical protein